MKNEVISLTDINVVYINPKGEKFNAVKNINLSVEDGEYLAILGSSGSGKTTLSNVIGLLNQSYWGLYYFDGVKVSGLSERSLGQIRGEKFGFIFQDYVLLDHLTALENVAMALQFTNISKKEILQMAKAKLMSVGMGDKLHHRPYQLSGGQKQRVAIARALVKNPRVIIADEPTGALDGISRIEILSLLQELNQQGVTIITVTHSKEDALAARRVIQVEKGEIVLDQYQRNRIRYFGRLLDIEDESQLSFRKKNVFEYLDVYSGISYVDEFLDIVDSTDLLVIHSAYKQCKPEWLMDLRVQSLIEYSFHKYSEFIQIMICMKVLEVSDNEKIWKKLGDFVTEFFSKNRSEESMMYFFKQYKKIPPDTIKTKINLNFFFSHSSERVRASSIEFFDSLGIKKEEHFKKYLVMLLKDDDYRVRSNILDFLYREKLLDTELLSEYHFECDPAPRVQAIWIEILKHLNRMEEASALTEKLILSHELPAILAGVWILAKEKEFNLRNFVNERNEHNPYILVYIDDIMKTCKRVREEKNGE